MEDVPEATVILEIEEKVPEVDQVTIENSGKRKPSDKVSSMENVPEATVILETEEKVRV
ncbi:hypothetical protein LguiA_008744 [Lonicera macranthoides]